MGRSKRGPALFELLDENSRLGLSQRRPETVDSDPDPDLEQEGNFAAEDAAGDFSGEPESESAGDKVASEGMGRAVWVDGERLHLSLTSVSAAGAAFAVLLMVAAGVGLGFRQGRNKGLHEGFEAGRTSYVAETTSDIEAARQQAPATYLVGGLLTPESKPARGESGSRRAENDTVPKSPAATDGRYWIEDYTYVVAQEFMSRNAADAEPARRFLSEHGIDCVPVQLAGGQVQLITTQGFDRTDPAQRKLADQLLEKVRAVGSQYFASGGRYRLEGYFKTHTGES